MKITSPVRVPHFGANESDINFDASKKKEKKYVDPLATWPLRGLGYTNDIGVAINEVAPTAARLFWVPSLMYFGADVYDKYKNKGNKYDPNEKRAFSQAVFQAFASIILPATFGHIGQSAFSQVDKFRGEKLSTNAKEQTLRFIKNYSSEHAIFNKDRSQDEIINEFTKSFDIFFADKKQSYAKKNFIVKAYDKLLANCKRGAIANSAEARLKDFAKAGFKQILNTCENTDVLKDTLDKQIFKLKAWKSLGSFAALLLTVKPIDTFVEKVIIQSVVEPQMNKWQFSSKPNMATFSEKK